MSVNRSTLNVGSGKRTMRVIVDVFKWTRYSVLHKWLVVSLVTLAVSWQFSMWTLIPVFIAMSVAGVKLSEQVLHHQKASHVAEMLFYKLESAYIDVRSYVYYLGTMFSGKSYLKDDCHLSEEMLTELGSVYEVDGDRSNDSNIPVRMSTDLRLEINSIQLLIIRDFVRSWYSDFSYDPQFVKETKYYLQGAFNTFILHLAQQDPQLLLTRIIRLYHFHFSMYQRAQNSLQSHKIHPETKIPEHSTFKRHLSLEDAFENTTSFHPALQSQHAEVDYLKAIVSIVVLSVCNPHVIEGPCVKTLLIQILTNKVMLTVMDIISNPDWLMEAIIILTSDEKVISNSSACPGLESDNENTDKGDKSTVSNEDIYKGDKSTVSNENISMTSVSPDLTDSEDVFQLESHHDSKYTLPLEVEDSHRTDGLEESERSFCGHDLSLSVSSSQEKAEFLRESCTQPISASYSLIHSSGASNSLSFIHTNSYSHQCQAGTDVEDMQVLSKDDTVSTNIFSEDMGTGSFSSVSDEDMKNISESELDTDMMSSNLLIFEKDPQKIMSYGHKLSQSSLRIETDSAIEHSTEGSSHFIEHSTEGSSFSADSVSCSETVPSSFPKLSSIKNFFVDSLKAGGKQQFVKKPKTLSLISEKFSSNLKPVVEKRNLKERNNGHTYVQPPQLLVDGVPVEGQSLKLGDGAGTHPTPTFSDSEMTPSPGMFSSGNSFLSLSTQNDLNRSCETEGQTSSPVPSPSPTGQDDFGAFAIIKNSSELKPYEMDDRRIFQDVTIPQTSISREFRSTSQYSLYNIEYEALYFTEEGKSVMRSGKVRRRYREFLSLQSRLESHRGYRKYLKNMKVPKRWPTIPFKSNDKETVETRRHFLEKYLKDLIEIEAICNGPDLREFLAYEGHSHIAFVNKSPDITVPRFDKMLMRGVSEVVDRIKALPNIPQEMMSGLRARETPEDKQSRGGNQFGADVIEVNTACLMDVISENSNILHISSLQVLQDLDTEDEKDIIHSVITDPKNVEQANEAFEQEVEKLLANLPTTDTAKTGSSDNTESGTELSLAVLDLLIQGLLERDHWMCRERVVKSMHSVLGKALNRYLENALSSLTTQTQLVSYLKTLRETIWPQGHLRSGIGPAKSEEEKAATREKAKRSLIGFFPVSVRLVIGKQDFEDMMEDFLSSLQSPKMNRHILYVILDMLVEQIFPEVRSHDLLHSLLFSRSRKAQMS